MNIKWKSGLSPRVRGNPSLRASRTRARGSIPACAGEPPLGVRYGQVYGVYPRVCGGTWQPAPTTYPQPGLSPRVRGNLESRPAGTDHLGSIPACAGEPRPDIVVIDRNEVYPRVCGGTAPGESDSTLQPGLSPRVRGNLSAPIKGPFRLGSIPACAGEPLQSVVHADRDRVYPRVCGGT